ncbi:MAG: hypothetical protein HON90_05805 [Halobacteriovoraceae bacterium]|jgi:hypothetical protein|nr:hypothetical protein [Halobacteriovoraceae bacterium]
MKLLLGLLLLASNAFAVSIKDYEYYDYQVYFTNPQCQAYEYNQIQYSFAGDALRAKPENVYCKYNDASKNQKRKSSPHYNIKKLISNPAVESLTMAYLSFSNSDIINTVCDMAIRKNNTKVILIIDKKNKDAVKNKVQIETAKAERSKKGSQKRKTKWEKIQTIIKCKPAQKYIDAGVANYPEVHLRGHSGGIGYAHNKIIYATYDAFPDKVTTVFSSGNMSSGTVLHHENWHFLTTSRKSYFAQAHECVLNGMKDHSKFSRMRRGSPGATGINNFKSFMKSCRAKITVPEEEDIKLSVVPSDGEKTMKNIVKNIKQAKKVSIAVHRFTHRGLLNALKRASKKKEVRFIADDDIFWVGKVNELPNKTIECNPSRNPTATPVVGANMCSEYFYTQSLKRSGAQIKYMQTNQELFLLHHNKYILFEYADGSGALHCGAGNFTKAAFTRNFENYYFITIPEVVERFKNQYNYVWNNLATAEKDLPNKQVLP